MANLIKDGMAWLTAQLNAHAASLVTYTRGADSVQVYATKGRTKFEVEDGYGTRIETEVLDFLILAADLVLAGCLVEPQRGDRIADVGSTIVYEVMAPGGEQDWRYSDPYRQTLRIHTKRVE